MDLVQSISLFPSLNICHHPLSHTLPLPSPLSLLLSPFSSHPSPISLLLSLFSSHPSPLSLLLSIYSSLPSPLSLHLSPFSSLSSPLSYSKCIFVRSTHPQQSFNCNPLHITCRSGAGGGKAGHPEPLGALPGCFL